MSPPSQVVLSATRVKAIQFGIFAMMGVTVGQYIMCRNLLMELHREKKRYAKLQIASLYLLNTLEEQDVELTEFDVIAINAIVSED